MRASVAVFVAVWGAGLCTADAMADVHKCRGQNGQIEYTSLPCGPSTKEVGTIVESDPLTRQLLEQRGQEERQKLQNQIDRNKASAAAAAAATAAPIMPGPSAAPSAAIDSAYYTKKLMVHSSSGWDYKTQAQIDAEAGVKASRPRAAPQSQPQPIAPSTITNCDQGGCWDNMGNRYNGSGTTLFRSDGKTCQRIGAMMECN